MPETDNPNDLIAQVSAESPDGRQMRWEEHNQARRKRLLDAAIELLDEGEVGAQPRMAEIAERAGLRRTVIYRYFTDRQELQWAIEQETAARLMARIFPKLDVHKPIIEIIHDSIDVYVRWSEEHPSLRWLIDRGAQSPDGPVREGISDISQVVAMLVLAAVDGYDMQVTETERRYVDPLVHGLVEAVVGTVRRWVTLEDPPPTKLLVHLAAESVWFIMEGHAKNLGVTLTRDQKLSELPSFD